MIKVLKMACLPCVLFSGLLVGYVPALWASNVPVISQENARKVIAEELEQDLMCKGMSEHDRADDAGDNVWLKAAGAVIKMVDDAFYNNYTYSFKEPLMVKGMPVYSVTQTVVESGAIFTAEVQGDPVAFAKIVHAKAVKKSDDIFGLAEVLFHAPMAKKGTEVIIGVFDDQKAGGRFYFGCSQLMDL